jgi:hypothetical protein
MASRLLSSLGQAVLFVAAHAFRVVAIATDEDSSTFASWPTITGGTAAPSEAQPNGSLYLRANSSPSLYLCTGGAWVAFADVGSAILSALAAAATTPIRAILTPAAEAGNAISVGIQIKGLDGANVARVQRLRCQIYDVNMLHGVVGSWRAAETGPGTEVSVTAKPQILIDTDANGAASVTVTDVSGTYAGTVYLEVVPENGQGVSSIVSLTFA